MRHQRIRLFVAIFLAVLMAGIAYAAVNVRGPSSGADAEVNATSKAVRSEPWDAAGSTASSPTQETWRGMFPINVRQSAATTNGAVVWAIWNQNGTKTVLIKRISIDLFFDGTAAATLMKYELVKATAVTVFSGGTAPTPLLKRTGFGSAVSAVCRVLDTGLTTTGITVQNTPWFWTMGRVTQTTTAFAHNGYMPAQDHATLYEGEIELANQEMLAIRNNVTSVIGDNIVGYCEVAER